jgi:hypothetical protein
MLVSISFLFYVGRGESNASVKSPKSPFYILVVSVAMLQTHIVQTYTVHIGCAAHFRFLSKRGKM